LTSAETDLSTFDFAQGDLPDLSPFDLSPPDLYACDLSAGDLSTLVDHGELFGVF
jgi:hypothetical protein